MIFFIHQCLDKLELLTKKGFKFSNDVSDIGLCIEREKERANSNPCLFHDPPRNSTLLPKLL
jgi:hypothetical protein